jgi:hypothetical protein
MINIIIKLAATELLAKKAIKPVCLGSGVCDSVVNVPGFSVDMVLPL